MRHLMSSFLSLHWAVFFALLGYLCIDAGNLGAAEAMFGANVIHDTAAAYSAAAPVAVAFLVVAALFCWLFVEANFGQSGISDGVVKIAFVAGAAGLSVFLIGSVIHGAGAPPSVAAYLTALVASYVAVLAECRTEVPRQGEAEAAVRVFAREAAGLSLLGSISGRPRFGRER